MRNHIPTLTAICLLIPCTALCQNWGVGFRLGDPSGLTVKKYWAGHGFEVSFGRTHIFSGSNFYYDRYSHWYDDQHFNYKEHEFLGYQATVPLGLQLHYLVQKNISGATGLDWYYGFGGQFRTQQYRYNYRYKAENGPEWITVYDERVTETDLGLDGVIGLEYKFKDAPVSLFMDGTLFMELIDEPFLFNTQFGLGARFRF